MNVSNLFISLPSQIGTGVTFKVLAEATLTGDATSIDTGAFTSTGYNTLEIQVQTGTPSAGCTPAIRFNNDAGAEYNWGWVQYDATHGTAANDNQGEINNSASAALTLFGRVNNISAADKYLCGMVATDNSSSFFITYHGAAALITRVQLISQGAVTFPAGSSIRVLGV